MCMLRFRIIIICYNKMLRKCINDIILRLYERKNNIKSKNYFYPKYLSRKCIFFFNAESYWCVGEHKYIVKTITLILVL